MDLNGTYDVKAYGAVGNGEQDDAPAIQNTIQTANSRGGGLVWFPPGIYRLDTGLMISGQVLLAGSGWQVPTGHGSWLYVTRDSVAPISVTESPTDGRGAIIRDIAIRYCQPKPSGAGWAPRDYPYAIQVRADDTYLHNIFLLNPTRGISVENPTGAVGRVVLDRIWGQPLLAGIQIDDAKDVVTVNNVHFWPFWSQTDHISSYQMRNGHAIRSFRNDNPRFSNIFALGYANGFYFGRGPQGATSKFGIANADLDLCGVGLRVDGDDTTGQIVNFTAQGDGTTSSPVGLRVEANNVKIQGSNLRVTNYAANGVRVEGTGTVLSLENVWVENWDLAQRGFPAIEAVSPAMICVGHAAWFDGRSTNYTGGTGTVMLDK